MLTFFLQVSQLMKLLVGEGLANSRSLFSKSLRSCFRDLEMSSLTFRFAVERRWSLDSIGGDLKSPGGLMPRATRMFMTRFFEGARFGREHIF